MENVFLFNEFKFRLPQSIICHIWENNIHQYHIPYSFKCWIIIAMLLFNDGKCRPQIMYLVYFVFEQKRMWNFKTFEESLTPPHHSFVLKQFSTEYFHCKCGFATFLVFWSQLFALWRNCSNLQNESINLVPEHVHAVAYWVCVCVCVCKYFLYEIGINFSENFCCC